MTNCIEEKYMSEEKDRKSRKELRRKRPHYLDIFSAKKASLSIPYLGLNKQSLVKRFGSSISAQSQGNRPTSCNGRILGDFFFLV